MRPTAIIEHFTAGRLRVRVPDRRGDVSYFRSAIEKLSEHSEIASLRANPITGSILIQHEINLSLIREIAARSEVFDLQESSAPLPRPAPSSPNRQVSDRGVTGLDGSGATEIGLIGLAFYQAIRGHALGPASENFWNAFGGMRILNNPLIAIVFGGLGILQLTRGRWVGSASSLLFYAFIIRQLSDSRSKFPPAENRNLKTPLATGDNDIQLT
ncbi:hypothetical protein IE4872_CH03248 [Rhizobium gallicum]|uniref:Uncharacterized protein n=1 Tax=Rhizobium gallicum TaxID=56730 RepID=A0A1L5NLU3_9HYPH|nr:hypothetical protein [Rhizobium gallicum]APO68848.1 hypothetical protein IE4872_CH03248 [Rhizobium gallicum]